MMRSRSAGFTLVELLVVVLIIGVLAAIALPRFLGQRTQARNAAAQAAVRHALVAARSWYSGDGRESYAGLCADASNARGENRCSGKTSLSNLESSLGTSEPSDNQRPGPAANPQDIWLGNGSSGTDPTGGTAVMCSVSRGDTVYCIRDLDGVASYYAFTGAGVSAGADASLYASSGWSSPATVNLPIAGTPTITGTARQGTPMQGSAGSWSASPAITSWSWVWLRCDSSGANCSDIGSSAGTASGSAAPSIPDYPPASGDVGSTLRLRVTATNSAGSTSAESGASGVVAAQVSFSQAVTATSPLHWWRMSGTSSPLANSGSATQTLPLNNTTYANYTYSQSSLIPSDSGDLSILASGKTNNGLAALSQLTNFAGYAGTSAFSWAMVIKINAGGGCSVVNYDWLIWRGPGGTMAGADYHMYLDCATMKIGFERCNIGVVSDPVNFSQNLLLVFTYNGSNMKLFVNSSSPSASVSNTCSLSSNAYDLVIGSAPGFAYGRAMYGYYSEILHWNRALSDSEAASLYNGWAG